MSVAVSQFPTASDSVRLAATLSHHILICTQICSLFGLSFLSMGPHICVSFFVLRAGVD
ncbi:unnamed protein product [Staurois parvus]|uniref:Uncharacterized protein n=1 Tax=Staurois parvus TaxID=386267 RepID=A0ABN9C976_9NEOB|nr:unnamed protein product [Staurois parvus]